MNTLKMMSLPLAIILLMSATKCEKSPEPRQLKKNIAITQVETSTFMNSSAFNFSEQAKERFSASIFSSPYFYERAYFPSPADYFNAQQNPQLIINGKITPENQKLLLQPNLLHTWFPHLSQNLKVNNFNLTNEASCLVTKPQHYISAKILSLEAHSGGSLVFGFNQSYAQLPLQMSFSFDRMKMDMVTNAFDPWSKERTQSQISSLFKKDMAMKIGLDLGIINIGPQIYRKTGLAEVTQQIITDAIKKMGSALNTTHGQEWKSRIIINQDNYVAIVGGEELGIQVGDQFIVENENHQWLGQPCGENSILTSSFPTTLNPWTVEIDKVGFGISRAKVMSENTDEQIQIGASVKIKKLVIPKEASHAAEN